MYYMLPVLQRQQINFKIYIINQVNLNENKQIALPFVSPSGNPVWLRYWFDKGCCLWKALQRYPLPQNSSTAWLHGQNQEKVWNSKCVIRLCRLSPFHTNAWSCYYKLRDSLFFLQRLFSTWLDLSGSTHLAQGGRFLNNLKERACPRHLRGFVCDSRDAAVYKTYCDETSERKHML